MSKDSSIEASKILELWLGTLNRTQYVIEPEEIGKVFSVLVSIVSRGPRAPAMQVPGYDAPEEAGRDE